MHLLAMVSFYFCVAAVAVLNLVDAGLLPPL
jgi:hypothetical protein